MVRASERARDEREERKREGESVCARARARGVCVVCVSLREKVWVHAVTLPLDGWVEDQGRTEGRRERGADPANPQREPAPCSFYVRRGATRDIFDIRHLAIHPS